MRRVNKYIQNQIHTRVGQSSSWGSELAQFISLGSTKSPKEFILATCSLASFNNILVMTANLSISSDRSSTCIGLILHSVVILLLVEVMSPGKVGGEAIPALGGMESSSTTSISSSICSELISGTCIGFNTGWGGGPLGTKLLHTNSLAAGAACLNTVWGGGPGCWLHFTIDVVWVGGGSPSLAFFFGVCGIRTWTMLWSTKLSLLSNEKSEIHATTTMRRYLEIRNSISQ